jgi:uncharacterized protein (DUF2336 family)
MESRSLDSLDNLAEIRLRSGVDMRPTLVRVLTDLYMQKLSHTPDEERHYTELALRLLEVVDPPTRAVVARRLARHLAPPIRVIQYLVNDLPEIAAPLRSHPLLQPAKPAGIARQTSPRPSVDQPSATTGKPARPQPENAPNVVDTATARELNELFFAANGVERGFILRNFSVVAPNTAPRVDVSRNLDVGERLEAAALARNRENFARQLALSLHIPREQARRIARDGLGESIVIAAKALSIPRDVVYRILLFANPAEGHSVERVHALTALFDEITRAAAEGMVAIWQALPKDERATTNYQQLAWDDETRRAVQPMTSMPRPQAAPQSKVRRHAS